jgi:hypothetical protein
MRRDRAAPRDTQPSSYGRTTSEATDPLHHGGGGGGGPNQASTFSSDCSVVRGPFGEGRG